MSVAARALVVESVTFDRLSVSRAAARGSLLSSGCDRWGSETLPKKELFFNNVKDPYQLRNLIGEKKYSDLINIFRDELKNKMYNLNDTFPASSWYRENWIKNRNIKKTATIENYE